MKRILLSTVAFAGLTAGAMAADLPSRRPPPVPFVAVPVFTWTGFYIGVNAGYGFSDSQRESTFTAVNVAGANAPLGRPTSGGLFGNTSRDGFVGGGQLGYNYQIGSFVIGVEADAQYTDFGNTRRGGNFATYNANGNLIGAPVAGQPGNVAFFNNNSLGTRSDYFGTVRGRVGYAFDRVLVYGTGGFAYRDTGSRNDGFVNGAALVGTGFYNSAVANVLGNVATPSFTRRRLEDTGYAVGGGVEYAFTPNVTAKIEGLYVNFGDNNRTGGTVGVTNTGSAVVRTGSRQSDDFVVVRAGLNYKFNLF